MKSSKTSYHKEIKFKVKIFRLIFTWIALLAKNKFTRLPHKTNGCNFTLFLHATQVRKNKFKMIKKLKNLAYLLLVQIPKKDKINSVRWWRNLKRWEANPSLKIVNKYWLKVKKVKEETKVWNFSNLYLRHMHIMTCTNLWITLLPEDSTRRFRAIFHFSLRVWSFLEIT